MDREKSKAMLKEIGERERLLKELLTGLSKSQKVFKGQNIVQYVEKIKKIYAPYSNGEKYRHRYSIIFPLLTKINESKDSSTETLIQNLEYLRTNVIYEKIEDYNIISNFEKLFDHINLEMVRMTYTVATDTKLARGSDELQKQLEDLKKNAKNLSDEQNETKNELKNSQKDYISILGIFSSIVLAFNAAMSISNSIFENINSASIYRLLLTTCVLGIIVNSVLCILINFIKKVWKDIGVNEDYYWSTNFILGFIILLTCIAYYNGWFSKKEIDINIIANKVGQLEEENKNLKNEIKKLNDTYKSPEK